MEKAYKQEIVSYSADDKPQLLNSTLLRVPEDKKAEHGVTSQQIEIAYNSAGLPKTRKISPHIYNLYGVNGERYSYDQNNRLTELCYLDINGEPVCNKLGIMSIRFQYEEKTGNLHSICYYSDEYGKEKTEGFYGVFCEKYEYDDNGNIVERQFQGRDENWWCDNNNVYKYRYTYNAGLLTQENYYNFDDTPAWNKSVKSSVVCFEKNREKGKDVILISFDTNTSDEMSDISGKMAGISIMKRVTNEVDASSEELDMISGERVDAAVEKSSIEKKQSDLEGESDFGRKYLYICYALERDGSISERSYLNAEKELVENECGYAAVHFQYDKEMHIIEESYTNVEDRLCVINSGYAIVKNEYDINGKIQSTEYLDMNKNWVVNKDLGYACVCYEVVTQNGNETIKQLYYEQPKKPIYLFGKGYAVMEQTYDKRGFLIQENYYNEKNVPVYRNDYGVAEILYYYADNGNLIREWYRDVNKKVINRIDTGYAVVKKEYHSGQLVRESYEGYQNQIFGAVSDKKTGVADIRYSYDKGNKVREEYLDADGEAVSRYDTGYAGIQMEYNEYGKCTAEYYLGADGKPAISTKYHCAGIIYRYNERGKKAEISYTGLDGKLMVRDDLGYARKLMEYDEQGNKVGEAYFDESGSPAAYKEGGYASYRGKYENGRWVEGRYYGTDGELVLRKDAGYAIIKNRYDEFGQRIQEQYYGADEQPVISNRDHCAGHSYEYDEKGNTTYIWYYNLNGETAVHKDYGASLNFRVFDDYNNIIWDAYYILDNSEYELVNRKDMGYAAVEYLYENNILIEKRYLNENRELVMNKETGYAAIGYTYDSTGEISELVKYDQYGMQIEN